MYIDGGSSEAAIQWLSRKNSMREDDFISFGLERRGEYKFSSSGLWPLIRDHYFQNQ